MVATPSVHMKRAAPSGSTCRSVISKTTSKPVIIHGHRFLTHLKTPNTRSSSHLTIWNTAMLSLAATLMCAHMLTPVMIIAPWRVNLSASASTTLKLSSLQLSRRLKRRTCAKLRLQTLLLHLLAKTQAPCTCLSRMQKARKNSLKTLISLWTRQRVLPLSRAPKILCYIRTNILSPFTSKRISRWSPQMQPMAASHSVTSAKLHIPFSITIRQQRKLVITKVWQLPLTSAPNRKPKIL